MAIGGDFGFETGGSITLSDAVARVKQNTTDGADNKLIQICGGGTGSNARGGYLEARGNEHASFPGSIALISGAISSSKITAFLAHAGSVFQVEDSGSNALVQINATGEIILSQTGHLIRQNTSDASDTKSIGLCGGGGSSGTRGSFFEVHGNEHATRPGWVRCWTGDVAASKFYLQFGNSSSTLELYNSSGGLLWSVSNSTGAITQDASNGGSLILPRVGASSIGVMLGASSLDGALTTYTTATPSLTIKQNPTVSANQCLVASGAHTSGAWLAFLKTRGTGTAANVTVVTGDQIGRITFGAADGSAYYSVASIQAVVTDTVSAGITPGELRFITTNSAGTHLTRWSITSSGYLYQDGTNGGPIIFNQALGQIIQGTSDGADTKMIQVCGGGSASPTRGGYVNCYGNEAANPGRVEIISGAIANSKIIAYLGISSALFEIQNSSNAALFQVNHSGNILLNTTAPTISLNTSDASDTGSISISGGGTAADSTRGGGFRAYGNEHGSYPGGISIFGGAVTNAHLNVWLGHSTSLFKINNSSGTELWRFTDAGDLKATGTSPAIINNTTDGSDTARISICGGGSLSSTRGAQLHLYGNEHASSPGNVSLGGGNATNAHVTISTAGTGSSIYITPGGSNALIFGPGPYIQVGGSGLEATGAGSAALGANCPAVTASAPYKWIKIKSSDGSDCYIPAWK